jgi:hypothetical protein
MPIQSPDNASIVSTMIARTASVAELTGSVLGQHRLAVRLMAGSTMRCTRGY